MKTLPIASFALALALSGCSSSPSIEEQTKLIEYEKCLDFRQTRNSWAIELLKIRETFDPISSQDEFVKILEAVQKYRYADLLKECEEYRP